MKTSTLVNQVTNTIAPKIMVEETLPTEVSVQDLPSILSNIASKYGLEVVSMNGGICELKFPGNTIVDFSNVKVVLGASPNPGSYEKLHSKMRVTIPKKGQITCESYERMILGVEKEIAVYRAVLQQRLDCFKTYLSYESVISENPNN